MIDASPLLNNNLVFWARTGMSGSGTWPDSSGNANTVTLDSGTWAFDAPGSVVSLNGSTDYMTAANSSSLNITGELTLSCYCKINAGPGAGKYPNLCGKWTDFTGYGLYVDGGAGTVVAQIGTSGVWRSIGTAYTTGVWTHWAMAVGPHEGIAGTDVRLFKDGKFIARIDNSPSSYYPATNTTALQFGRHYSLPATYGYLSCIIASATIHNRKFADSEIPALYNLMRY